MLGVVTEFEPNLPRERQLEGYAAAKERGAFYVWAQTVDHVEVQRLRVEG